MKTVNILKTFLKIFLEIFLMIIILLVVQQLFWFLILFLIKDLFQCTITDTGFMRPGYMTCPQDTLFFDIFKSFIFDYQKFIAIPFFFIYVSLLLGPLYIIFIALISTFLIIFFSKKDSHKFPIILRFVLKKISFLKKKLGKILSKRKK